MVFGCVEEKMDCVESFVDMSDSLAPLSLCRINVAGHAEIGVLDGTFGP